jgi:hypothetical protein
MLPLIRSVELSKCCFPSALHSATIIRLRLVKILTGSAWRLRDAIAPRLNKVAANNREQFAKLLYFSGYDAAVPGADPPERRPWH